jgi:hypothetical protein
MIDNLLMLLVVASACFKLGAGVLNFVLATSHS